MNKSGALKKKADEIITRKALPNISPTLATLLTDILQLIETHNGHRFSKCIGQIDLKIHRDSGLCLHYEAQQQNQPQNSMEYRSLT